MKILLTGATGYVGKRLLIQLLAGGHEVICSVRDKYRFNTDLYASAKGKITVIENDFLDKQSLVTIPGDINAAYYLIHSMSGEDDNFEALEKKSAQHFNDAVSNTQCKQVIFLTGIVNENKLSRHLLSRKNVEKALKSNRYALTCLRAGIIVGSGSASFEIIRDLVEKLPFMVAPVWIQTKCQPIAIRNVIEYLLGVLEKEDTYNKAFDIGGPEVLTYKQMLLGYAAVRNLKRFIITVPVMSPRLSSYWLYFITSTSYKLAKNLVESMKIDVIARPNDLAAKLAIRLLPYQESIELAFEKIKQNDVLSSWYDAFSDEFHKRNIFQYIEVPLDGCLTDKRKRVIENEQKTLDKIFGIGGSSGWYFANFLWSIRGLIDKLFGGVGLRRGRKNKAILSAGDSVDFWRVLFASREEKRLLLFAEMRIPGEAWLEFKIHEGVLFQTATFRPLGLLGRLYWYAVLPFHGLIFNGMIKKLANGK